jgi:hypothetical protein
MRKIFQLLALMLLAAAALAPTTRPEQEKAVTDWGDPTDGCRVIIQSQSNFGFWCTMSNKTS